MNFNYSDLMPWAAGTSLDWALFHLPLTPFFIDPGSYANHRTRGFSGDDFYCQFKGTRNFPEDGPMTDDPICGTAAFRVYTSVDHNASSPNPWNGSRTRSYEFDTDNNTVSIQTVEDGNPSIGLTHTRTATTAKQGDPFHVPPVHTEITLSESVDKAWLFGELERWGTESEEFRDATSSGLGTYSFIGHGATRTESDGYLAIVGGGDVVVIGPTFTGEAYGMTGDEGELWNGNFSSWVNTVTRKNAPVIHQESSPNALSLGANLAVGRSIYQDGHTEIEVSDPLGDVWMDEYGVFQASAALDGVPMQASSGYDLGNLISYTGDGAANELTLVSRTGKRYRVTIQTGRSEYDSDGSHWITSTTHVLTTDATTLKATLTLDPPDENTWSVRVASIEVEVETDEQTEWQSLADVEQGESPETLIGASVTGGFLLLAAIKKRSGSRFGFSSLDFDTDSDTRYRKQTFKLHLTPGTYHIDAGGCGGGVNGSADLEYVDEFDADTGIQLPRNVTQWSVTINGQDWTPETINGFDSLYFSSSQETTKTDTKIRREGEYETTGSFIVAFDAPDPHGKVLSSDWQKTAMNFADDINNTDAIDLDPPAAGQSLFFEGHRLTYDPPSG